MFFPLRRRLSQRHDGAEGVGREAQAAAAGVRPPREHPGHETCHQGAGNARVHSMYLNPTVSPKELVVIHVAGHSALMAARRCLLAFGALFTYTLIIGGRKAEVGLGNLSDLRKTIIISVGLSLFCC